MWRYILVFGFLISFLARAFFIVHGKHIADIWHLERMAIVFLSGLNPYLVLDFNAYPPGAIILQSLSVTIHNLYPPIAFHTIIKFWINLADFLTAYVIFIYLVKSKTSRLSASLWSVAFLLNPISIMISSSHGQLDSIPSLFVILSIFFLNFYHKKAYFYISALLFGLAITIKATPLMLLPVFLVGLGGNIKFKLYFLLLALTPIVVSLLWFVSENPLLVLTRVLGYSGVSDMSYSGVIKGLWYQINASPNFPLSDNLLSAGKFAFLSGVLFLTITFAGWKDLIKSSIAVYLLFFSVYSGIGAQYLSWIVPLGVLSKDKMIIAYSFTGFLALLGFYLFFGPDVLFGTLWSELPFQRNYMYIFFYGNLAFWFICIFWLIKTTLAYLKTSYPKFSPLRKKLILISLSLFVFSISSVFSVILQIIGLYAKES